MPHKELIPYLRVVDSDRIRVPAHIERRLERTLGHPVRITTIAELAKIYVDLLRIGIMRKLHDMSR